MIKKINPERAETERQMFVSLAEQSTEFIGICDMDFMPFFVNVAGLQTVGLDSLEEALQTPVKEFFFPEDQDFIYNEFFPRVIREGRDEVEIRFRHFKTGQPLWMIYNVFHVLDPEGKPVGFATVSRNITERKQVEEKLRESQADLNRAQAVGHIGCWRINVRENRVTWSDENHRIFGIPEGTPMTYETFLSTVHPDDKQYVDQMWQAGLRGEPYDIEHRLIVNGEVKWVREKAELEFDREGVLLGAFGTTQDITKRKQYDQVLREADQRKDEFLAVLAHELRNPLTPIRNAVAILKRSGSTDKMTLLAQDIIERQLQHTARLIDDLMDVSRITRGKLQLRKERVDLAKILEQTRETAQPHADQSGHKLTVSIPEEPVYIEADPVRLTQVFLNLLSNACKYTEKGGSISLTTEREGEEVMVKVTDTGIGIPAEHLSSVFDIFTQVSSDQEHNQGGLGIGLSLAQSLVDMHGGRIAVKSDGPGKGSEFTIRLPVLEQDTASETTSSPAFSQERDKSEPKALRVLVADDNRDIAESLDTLLKMCGHDVVTANDGMQAIEAAESFRPDVVLLDIGMPRMDGYDACESIREQPWGKDMKIFALSGMGREEDKLKSGEAGFSGHLVKPVDPEELLHLIDDQAASAT